MLAHLDECVKDAKGEEEVWGTAPLHESLSLVN